MSGTMSSTASTRRSLRRARLRCGSFTTHVSRSRRSHWRVFSSPTASAEIKV
ncbi:unnamed protein product [Symbiodinium natans]|uniref:Uncharacterized protein n=1 Tax=Symbiodinium natans TaxID=878477 RepID=A0A812S068_9DINO|nr:unnamed protein product [Symbiodinium natans]